MKKYILFILVGIASSYGLIVGMEGLPLVNYLDSAELKKMIAVSKLTLGDKDGDIDYKGSKYAHGRNEPGIHIIDIRKQFEKIQLESRFLVRQNVRIEDLQRKKEVRKNARIRRENGEEGK